jgi:hypothetical protein
MPGERFSALYQRPAQRAPDSDRARHRIGALFRESVFDNRSAPLASFVSRELGLPVPGDGRRSSDWKQFLGECKTRDFLDAVTLVYRYLYWHVGDGTAGWWRDVVRQIFADENLCYEIDEVGGIHPAVDEEFQTNNATVLAGLRSDRHRHVLNLFAGASSHLSADPPNYKQAWRATFAALEALFALMFPYVRLTEEEIDRRLRPIITHVYDGDAAAQDAALRMLGGLREWVEASRNYRHQPGILVDPAQPPADLAILAISHGAALLRWLAGLDEAYAE